MRKEWSGVEDTYLLENAHLLTQEQMGEALDRSRGAVRSRLVHLGLLNGVPRVCQNPLCAAPFYVEAYEVERGSGKFCSPQCLQQSNVIDIPLDDIKRDYMVGMSTTDLARKYGVSKGTIYNLFKRYGIEARTLDLALQVFYTTEAGQAAIQSRLETIQSEYGTTNLGGGGRSKKGIREDLGIYCRSSWEANALRWLSFQGMDWQYEPRVFYFENIKRGSRAYTPDVFLPKEDIWIEIKGYLDQKSRTKLKRMKKYYPEEFAKFHAIVGGRNTEAETFFLDLGVPIYAYYNDLKRDCKNLVPNWE